MIVYRPSRGNDSVTLTYTGEWAGKSLGREVIMKDKFGPTDYFLWYSSDLTADSSWFFKPVTNVDFTTGTTYYRALFIGPHERENLQEFVGTVASSVTECTSSAPTSDVQVSLWAEGVFTTKNSKQSIVIDNEADPTGVLSAGTFTPTLNVNQTLSVGQWLKVWVKIDVAANPLLVDANVCYVVTIGSLSIKINKDISRLSMSRVFHGDLASGDIIIKELIPKIDEIGKIHKVINIDPNQTHVFYNTVDDEFHNLIIERHNNAYDNKFIDVNASPITGPITGFETFADNTIKAVQDVFSCMVSGSLDQKYIVDIFATQLPDRSYFYIFYNQLNKYDDGKTVSTSAETLPNYNASYGHDKYRWTAGVISLDFNMFRKETFAESPAGYDNKVFANNWTGQDHKIRDDFFMTSISMQNDLFSTIGYNTENSFQTATSASPDLVIAGKNYFTEIALIWEKDILLDKIDPQILKTPSIAAVNTVAERSMKEAQLVIDNWNGIDNFDLSHIKTTYDIVNISAHNLKYCDLGSPHCNKLKHYADASIWFDTSKDSSEWSSTFAFRLPVSSLALSAATFGTYDDNNATHHHLVYKADHDLVTGGVPVSDPLLTLPASISGDISLFSINVKNSDYATVEVFYNPSTSLLGIASINTTGGTDMDIFGAKIYLGQENTVTVNTITTQVSDPVNCDSKVLVNYQIYVNGENIKHGSSYVFNSLDPLVLKYNPRKQFGGSLSYFELKDYLDKAEEYAKAMFKIHSNIAWAHPLYDTANTSTTVKELQIFQNKRIVNFNNLPVTHQELVVPIVLLGSGYKLKNYTGYNSEALRTYDSFVGEQIFFDFKKINLNTIDVAFTMLGDTKLLEWTADEYDVTNDRLTIWVRIPRYTGQRVVMYYNAQRIASLTPTERPNAFRNLRGAWTMNKFITTYGYRFVDQKIFNAGENMLFLQHDDEKYLVQIDYQYMYGFTNVYKSNKFDIAFDDRQVTPKQMPVWESFMREFVGQFKPDFMTINKVRSKFNYRLEIDNYTPKET
jgi:hypothetical protein